MATTNKKKKSKKNQTPEAQFNYSLNSYSKSKDLQSAISLYDTAVSNNIRLSQHHFNTLLYLCSISLGDPSTKELSLQSGFQIFDQMVSNGIKPNEASITAIARLAAARGDNDYAFRLVKTMGEYNALPRLRTYGPTLFGFCEKLEADKAYEVEEHMGIMGVNLEELEIAALLKVSVKNGREERVYSYLHKLRNTVRCVREDTAEIIEEWFKGFEDNGVELDVVLVTDTVMKNGGGWHGLGWIGKGRWVVRRGSVDVSGDCCCCREQLACVDTDDAEIERFAKSVASLALEREVKANFSEFQDWLEKHAKYEAIVDGANIGLYQQNFAEGSFSIPQVVQFKLMVLSPGYLHVSFLPHFCMTDDLCALKLAIEQLDAVVKDLYRCTGNKWPLIILHNKRVRALLENPSHRELIEEWIEKDVLYATPHGSNDDWYWLYAAVKLRCLLVTNDEMRDHIFELLARSFFLKWKERHQVRYMFAKGNLKLQMPPPFSVVIQESATGSWHVPIASDGNEESAQSWLCIVRQSTCNTREEYSRRGNGICHERNQISSSNSESVACSNNIRDDQDSFDIDDKIPPMLGKRKERSLPHVGLSSS